MPDTIPDASSIFLPWVRQGAAGTIKDPETFAATQPARISVPVNLKINNTRDVSVTVGLLGPGEVTGLDRTCYVYTTHCRLKRLNFDSHSDASVLTGLPFAPTCVRIICPKIGK